MKPAIAATALLVGAACASPADEPPPALHSEQAFTPASLLDAKLNKLRALDPSAERRHRTVHVKIDRREKPKTQQAVDDESRISATWLNLAQCESTLRWHIRNGAYSGGVQFIDSSWDAHRPASFPDEAWQASPWQQIFVAKRLLRAAGPGQWPVCSVRVGLTIADAA